MKIKEIEKKAYEVINQYINQCPDLSFLIHIERTKDAGNEWVPIVTVSFGRFNHGEWESMFLDKDGNATYKYDSSTTMFECFLSWYEGDIEDQFNEIYNELSFNTLYKMKKEGKIK